MESYAYWGVLAVAAIHVVAMVLEMRFWPWLARRLMPEADAGFVEQARPLAANQGLYNGFLAAGLVWSLAIGDPEWARNVATCFLLFVIVAGLYGAATVSRKTLAIQTAPGAVALALVWIG